MNKAEARRIERSQRRREALDLLPMKGPVKYDANFAPDDTEQDYYTEKNYYTEEDYVSAQKQGPRHHRGLPAPVGKWWDESNAELVLRTFALAVENRVLREQKEQDKALIATLEKAVPLRQSIGVSSQIGYVVSKVTGAEEPITRHATQGENHP